MGKEDLQKFNEELEVQGNIESGTVALGFNGNGIEFDEGLMDDLKSVPSLVSDQKDGD